MRYFCSAAVAVLSLFSTTVLGEEVKAILGQEVVVQKASDVEEELLVNGKRVLVNARVDLQETYEFQKETAIVGSSYPGGNYCVGSPFVLLIRKDGTSRLDGPLETCEPIDPRRDGDRLIFQTGRFVSRAKQTWIWSNPEGFVQQNDIPFAPDKGTTWAVLRGKDIQFIAQFFENEEFYLDAKQLLGEDYDSVIEFFDGPGTGMWKGDTYVGSVCRAHSCNEESFLMVVNLNERKIFAAWKPLNKQIEVYPSPVKTWSKAARLELKEWAADWN